MPHELPTSRNSSTERPSGEDQNAAPSSVAPPADLTLLSDYAETPEEMREFLETFIATGNECLEGLAEHCIEGHCTPWAEAAHKLKGGAGIVGARKLQELCAQAQDMEHATAEERKNALKEIETEFNAVKIYLAEKMPS